MDGGRFRNIRGFNTGKTIEELESNLADALKELLEMKKE